MINKVLIVMERFCDADPKCGPTNSEHMVVEAIKSTGLVREIKRFYFDVLCQKLGRDSMSELLVEDCKVFQPDLVIYTPLGGDLGEKLNPSKEVIQKIIDELGIKLYLILWDAKPKWGPAHGREMEWLPYASYLGIVDSMSAFLCYKENPKVILAYNAVSPRAFYNKNLERDIDVSFLGTIDPTDKSLDLRNEYTSFLRANGINIFCTNYHRTNIISVEEQCNILNRSKISLDFCRDGDGLPMLKSRVFKVMACKTFILEDWDTHTTYFFETGKDFVIFHSKEELLKLTHYYLDHDEEREAIALSGYNKATNIYNARNMWGYIFEKIGFKIPDNLAKDENYILHKEIMEHFYA